jgi:Na+/proline symporter
MNTFDESMASSPAAFAVGAMLGAICAMIVAVAILFAPIRVSEPETNIRVIRTDDKEKLPVLLQLGDRQFYLIER